MKYPNCFDIVYLGKAFAQGLDDLDAIMMGYANAFFQKCDYKTTVACIEWLRSTLRPGYPPEAVTWFDKYDCVFLVLCAETTSEGLLWKLQSEG